MLYDSNDSKVLFLYSIAVFTITPLKSKQAMTFSMVQLKSKNAEPLARQLNLNTERNFLCLD